MKFKKNEVVQGKAVARYVRISPIKIRRILDYIRNRSFHEATLILQFLPHKSSKILLKLINSAFSNVKGSFSNNKNLFITEARVDEGPFLKRVQPHAQGRGFPIKKRMSHIISVI